MVDDWSFLSVTDGTKQGDRLPLGLREGHFALQERGLADFFALAGAIAGTEPRGDGAGRHTGTWRDPFETEPAFLMAEIIAVRLDDLDRQFKRLISRDRLAAMVHLQRLAAQVSDWLLRLHSVKDARFDEQLKHLDLEIGIADVLSKMILASPSGLARQAVELLGGHVDKHTDPVSQARAHMRAVHDLNARVLNTIETLKGPAVTAFEARLKSGVINPVLGLLLAELRLTMDAGDAMNHNLGRHTDYFYGDILGQAARPATAHKLLLRVVPGVDTVLLPAETSWSMEQGGQTYRYQAFSDLLVQPTEVTRLASIRYDRNPKVMPQSTFKAITGIRADERDPMMPENGRQVFSPDPMVQVDQGLDIQSPMFALAEGERRIELVIRMKRRFRVMTEAGTRLAEVASARFNADVRSGVVSNSEPHPISDTVLDPEIERALLDDPDLIAVFGFKRMKPAIAEIARWLDDLQKQRKEPQSLTLLYHALALRVRNAMQLRMLFARLFQATVVEGAPWPDTALRQVLAERTTSCLADDDAAARTVLNTFKYPRNDSFQRWLGDAFDLSISTADGQVRVTNALPKPNRPGEGPGVTFNLMLPAAVAALVPPEGEIAPLLSIRQSKDAWISPILFFDAFLLERVKIRVDVRKLQPFTAFTDDGPADTANPFPAFGVRPDDGSSLMLASPELGNKPVKEISVAVRWAGMPKSPGGFATHYAGYSPDLELPDPKLAVSYLGGDGWKQLTPPNKPVQMMKTDIDGRLVPRRSLKYEVPSGVPAPTFARPDEYRSRKTIRAGAIRLDLSHSGGFLATDYPDALATAMRRGALPSLHRKRRMPLEPVMPKIARVELGYVAETTLSVNAPSAAKQGERLVEVGPFGKVEIYPSHLRNDAGLFPGRLADANGRLSDASLFIRLSGARVRQRQALIFEMEETVSDRVPKASGASTWHYMTSHGWRLLPETAIGSDTTDGLLRSGVVSIDLPSDAHEHAPEMPEGKGIWIAVSATDHLESFPVLRSVRTNGVWVEPVHVDEGTIQQDAPAAPPEPEAGVAPGARVWRVDRRGSEIGQISETGVVREGKPPEKRSSYLARISNRLAHRGRAVTPADIERLVLQNFPEVWKAKCFRTLNRRTPHHDPGKITVAVVPHAAKGASQPGWRPEPRSFDVQTLRKIRSLMVDIGSICADWDVVNPSFERLQVRTRVEFHPIRDEGALALRLKNDLVQALSVWTARSPLDGFGWRLNPETLKARINDQNYVKRVAEFSVVHLVSDDRKSHLLGDTARLMGNTQDHGGNADTIYAREPWSLPLSWPTHLVEAVGTEATSSTSGLAGISNLPVGELLVVQPRQIAGLLRGPEHQTEARSQTDSQLEVEQ